MSLINQKQNYSFFFKRNYQKMKFRKIYLSFKEKCKKNLLAILMIFSKKSSQ